MKTRANRILAAALVIFCCAAVENAESSPLVARETAITTLLQQAASAQEKGQADSALAYSRRAFDLASVDSSLPPRLMAEVYDRLGWGHFDQSRYDSAGLYLNQALAIAEKVNSDTLTADVLFHLGQNLYRQRVWDQAADCLSRTLAIKEDIYGPDHPALIPVLTAAVKICYRQYHYMDAEPLCQRLVAIATAHEGPASPALIRAYYYLGWVSESQMQFDAAQTYFQRAISVAEQQASVDYSELAQTYGMLCQEYSNAGNMAAAEETGRRALAIAEKNLGKNHLVTADVLMRLTGLYSGLNKFDLAESCARRALAIRQALNSGDNEQVAQSLYALGYVYEEQGRYPEAVAYIRMTCDMLHRMSGPEDPTLLRRQFSLAEIYTVNGQPGEAEKLLLEFMPVVEKILGPTSNIAVWAVNLLADVRAKQGREAEAETLLLGKLADMEEAYGPRYFFNGHMLESLMELYLQMGAPAKALQYGDRLLRLRQDLACKLFVLSSEDQKLSWVERNPVVISSLLSLALAYPGHDADSVAFDMVLHGKGIVFDAVLGERAAAFCDADPVVREGIKQRAGLCTAIADLSIGAEEATSQDSVREQLARLYDSLETVEVGLSRHCSDFGTAMAERQMSFAQVGNRLPAGSVLLEYVKYESDSPTGDDDYGPGSPAMRYLVFTLDRTGGVTLTYLGDAAEIDSLITQARGMIYDAERRIYSPMAPYLEERLKEVTEVLYRRLVAPVEKYLAASTGIFIAPDGMLNLLPFDILPSPDGSYLIEHYDISYLASGRDLVHFNGRSDSAGEALILGDPDYDLSSDKPSPLAEANSSIFASLSSTAPAPGPAGTSPAPGRRFLPLQYSREESMAIAATIGRTGRMPVRERYGAEAREEELKRMTAPPRILHFSTHGYFAADAPDARNSRYGNPLLRSGLALAGANRISTTPASDSGAAENGVLTALEVSGLDLHGTDLVTLSACETGVGEPSVGEGVFGLRRAFLHAGARSVVMSLWNVPDRETAGLMTRFYELWLGGMSKREALRTSALEILNRTRTEKGHGHPLFWGGFVLAGDPR